MRDSIKSKSFGKGGRKPDKGRGSLSSERLSLPRFPNTT
jgi:hypothetical protein